MSFQKKDHQITAHCCLDRLIAAGAMLPIPKRGGNGEVAVAVQDHAGLQDQLRPQTGRDHVSSLAEVHAQGQVLANL